MVLSVLKTGPSWLVILVFVAIAVHQTAADSLASVGKYSVASAGKSAEARNLEANMLAIAGQFSKVARKQEQKTITNESAVVGTLDPFTTLSEKEGGVKAYKVKRGETLQGIAKKFGISIETIKAANPSVKTKVATGQTLSILPVSGILYQVSENDTIELISEKYKVDPNLVKIYNPNYVDVLVSGNGTLILPNAPASAPSQKAAATSTKNK